MKRPRTRGLRAEVTWKREGDAPGFLLDSRTGGIFGVNGSAAVLLEGLGSGQVEEGLVALIVDSFDVSPLTARMDIRSFLGILEAHDLVCREA